MSLISPFPQNSTIWLYNDIDWNNTNQDIMWFSSNSVRQTYLSSRLINSYTQCSVVRQGRSIKVNEQINKAINAVYMAFENPAQLGTPVKRFYAFVTSVNYTNNNTVEIEYEIDWIQTYLFDFVFKPCFVEREHVNDDTIGLHTLSENLEVGEYVEDGQQEFRKNPAVFIYSTPVSTGQLFVTGGIASALAILGAPLTDLSPITEIIQRWEETPDKIPYITMGVTDMLDGVVAQPFTQTVNGISVDNDFTWRNVNYVAVNNKLLTYPYKFLAIDNYNGDVLQLRYENFQSGVSFTINGTPMPSPVMEMIPRGYRKASEDYQQESIVFDNFSQVGWTSESFTNWISQVFNEPFQSINALVSTVGGIAKASNPAIGAVSAVAGAAEFIEQHSQIQSPQYHVGSSQSGLGHNKSRVGFRVSYMHIKPEIAKVIDGYFTRYGYRVDTVKVPNVTGRETLNYVKTRQARVNGKVPVDARRVLEDAMNNGVTFWHTVPTDTIGNNPIIGGA